MKTFVLGAGLALGAGLLTLILLPTTQALADSDVLCVQQELASRGFDPGPLDGAIGPQTIEAAQSAGFSLSAGNAAAMCNELRPERTFSKAPSSEYVPPFVQRLEPRPTFNSAAPVSNCPKYVIDVNDPCF